MMAKQSKPHTLTTKSVYDPRSPQDGKRVLVMRFWPRGVRREAADIWFRELGTSPELIRDWKAGMMRWTEFRRAYQRGLRDPAARQAIHEIRNLLAQGPVTLLCSCREENRCHRIILKQEVLRSAAHP